MGVTDDDKRDPFAGIPRVPHPHLDHIMCEEWGGDGEQKTLRVMSRFECTDGRVLEPGNMISPNEARQHRGIQTRAIK